MKDLNDQDFDNLFKSRINEDYLDFEETSWLKMEGKLRSRKRLIFLRYAGVVLLLLSVGLASYWEFQPRNTAYQSAKIDRKVKPVLVEPDNDSATYLKDLQSQLKAKAIKPKKSENLNALVSIQKKARARNSVTVLSEATSGNSQVIQKETSNEHEIAMVKPAPADQAVAVSKPAEIAESQLHLTEQNKEPAEELPLKKTKTVKFPIVLSFVAGPDFSSTRSIIGGKSGASLGFNVGLWLTKKIALQTGLIYGTKNYDAQAMDYKFGNPYVASIISSINARCSVLEIPLRLSLEVSKNQHNSISFNGGISSYVMLSEKYLYQYTPESNRSNRENDIFNKNKHAFGVLDLSATYNIKLQHTKFFLGIEPYVKIPLTGIGEGGVPLKSNGIALKLNYDFTKD